MPPKELPEPWKTALHPGVTSIRGLATAAAISPMAASRLIKGEGTSVPTVRAVADALFDGDRDQVWGLYGLAVSDHGDFGLPDEAALLDTYQRDTILRVMRAMLPPEMRGGGAGGTRSGGPKPTPLRPVSSGKAGRIATPTKKAARKKTD